MTVGNRKGSIVWLSPSGLRAYLDCPRRAASRGPTSPQMLAGLVRHEILESYYSGVAIDLQDPAMVSQQAQRSKRWSALDLDTQRGIVADIVSAASREGFLPDRETVISCEGSGLPKEHTCQMYDSTLLQGYLSPSVGLRMRMDLICWSEQEPSVVVIPDFKGRSEDDWSLAGMCYALGAALAFTDNGFTHARFEALYLGSCKRESYEYELSPERLEEYRSTILEIAARMQADHERKPTLNKWCRYCHLQSDCTVYSSAVAMPAPVTSVEAVKEYQLPAADGDLIDLREKLKVGEGIVNALKDRVDEELKHRLEAGSVHHAGREWKLIDKTTRYDVTPGAAFHLASELAIPLEDVVKIDHTPFKAAVDKVISRMKRDGKKEEAELIQRRFDEARIARKSVIIQGRTERVEKREVEA